MRVYTQPAEVKLAMCKLGLQVQCARCPQFHVHPLGHVPTSRMRPRPPKNTKKHGLDGKLKYNPDDRADDANNNDDDDDDGDKGDEMDGKLQTVAADAASSSSPPSPPPPPPPQRFPAVPPRTQNAANFHPDAFGDHVPIGGGGDKGTCSCCGGRLLIGGPIYAAPMHNHAFLEKLIAEIERRGPSELKGFDRVRGLVTIAREELADVPLFTELATVASELRMCCPPNAAVIRALHRRGGYRVSSTHPNSGGFKTDCPMRTLMGVLLQYKLVYGHDGKKQSSSRTDGDGANTTTANLHHFDPHQEATDADLAAIVPDKFRGRVAPDSQADFSEYSQAELAAQRGAVASSDTRATAEQRRPAVPRFVLNAPHWGPRARHTGADGGTRRERE